MLTGRVLALAEAGDGGISGAIRRMVRRIGEPVILSAVRERMRLLARFVMGRTIEEALDRAAKARRWRYSFEMLDRPRFASAAGAARDALMWPGQTMFPAHRSSRHVATLAASGLPASALKLFPAITAVRTAVSSATAAL